MVFGICLLWGTREPRRTASIFIGADILMVQEEISIVSTRVSLELDMCQ